MLSKSQTSSTQAQPGKKNSDEQEKSQTEVSDDEEATLELIQIKGLPFV